MLNSHQDDIEVVYESFEKFDDLVDSGLDQCLDDVFANISLDYQMNIF